MSIQKVEVIRAELPFWLSLFATLFSIAWRTFFVWFAVASFFPEWGITYWQAVLPVYAARMLFGGSGTLTRTFKPASWKLPA